MRQFLAFLSALLLQGAALLADPCYITDPGLYIAGYGGAHWWQDSLFIHEEDSNYYRDYEFKSGYVGGVSLGYRCASGLRIELDGSWRHNDLDRILAADGAAALSISSFEKAELQSLNYFANLLYEPRYCICGCTFQPYVGGGLGAATVKLKTRYTDFSLDDEDTVLAFQVIAGMVWPIFSCLDFGLEYRYMSADYSHFETSTDISGFTSRHFERSQKKWLQSHAVLITTKLIFW